MDPEEQVYEAGAIDAPPEVEGYRSLSVLAIITTLVGLFSFLALLSSKLWFLVVLTLILGAVSLVVLARNPEKTGRGAVVFAMVLASFFGSWTMSRWYARQTWLYTTARPFADEWLELVQQNDLYTAYQLHVPRDRRINRKQTLDEYFDNTPGIRIDFDSFFANAAIQALIEHGEEATVEYDRLIGYFPEPAYEIITLQYRIHYEEDGEQQSKTLLLDMVRDLREVDGVHDWYLGRTADREEIG